MFRLVSYSQNQESETGAKTGQGVVPEYVNFWIKRAEEESAKEEDAGFGFKSRS